MNVDPQQLRALSISMDTISEKIDALDIRTNAEKVAGAMRGSPLGAVCAAAGEYIEGAWLRQAMRCKRISNICRGAADSYEVADTDFRDSLAAMAEEV